MLLFPRLSLFSVVPVQAGGPPVPFPPLPKRMKQAQGYYRLSYLTYGTSASVSCMLHIRLTLCEVSPMINLCRYIRYIGSDAE